MSTSPARDRTIDAFRGLAMVLVVVGHVPSLPAAVHAAIYSFHMPAFFMLSGYFFRPPRADDAIGSTIARRAFRLIVPAVAWAAICGIPYVYFLISGARGITESEFVDRAIGAFTGSPAVAHNFMTSPLWFLYALFFTDLAAIVLARTLRYWRTALGVLGVAGALMMPNMSSVFGITQATSACLFFAIGASVSGVKPVPKISATSTIMVLGLWLLLMTSPYVEAIDMSTNTVGALNSLPANTVCALLGTIALLGIAQYAGRWSTTEQLLRSLGSNSIPIMAMNYWVTSTIASRLSTREPHSWLLNAAATTLALLAIAWLVRRSGKVGRILNGEWNPKGRSPQ